MLSASSRVLLRWRLRRALEALPARLAVLVRCFLAGFVAAMAGLVALVAAMLAVPALGLGLVVWALWPSSPPSK